MYYKSNAKWQKKNTKLETLRLNIYSDADIIKYLSTIDNKQGHLKALLRAEMAEKGFAYPHPSKKEVDKYEEYLCDLEYGEIDENEDFANEKEE